MLDVTSLLDSVASWFPDYQQVEESIYRFERKEKGAPFAVYFLDFTEDLPSEAELALYQDRVIGRYYFEGEKSLQWSNYLYFLMSAQKLAAADVRSAKVRIEGDRRYARKFVMAPEELGAALKPQVVTPARSPGSRDILSIWTESLEVAGIYDAVVSNSGVRARVERIQDLSTPVRRTRTRRQQGEPEPASFIRSLELTDYRPFPRSREFRFGTVNLLVGANGSGKTSLLEAVELFYCGRNKRNPGEPPPYRLLARLADGRAEDVANGRPLQDLRDRNLAWYGVDEVNATNLHHSFARFNFLDTDAAVSLAETTETLQDDLSRLLVGPEAARMWREIERISDAVTDRLRNLRPRAAQVQEELRQLNEQLIEVSLITPESDALKARLAVMLERLYWSTNPTETANDSDVFVQALSELVSAVQQAIQLTWIGSPVTCAKIADYLRTGKTAIEVAKRQLADLEDRRRTERQLADEMTRSDEAASLTEKIKLMYAVGLPDRIAEYRSLQAAKNAQAAKLVGHNPDVLRRVPSSYLDLTVSAGYDRAFTACSIAESNLAKSKEELAAFKSLRDKSVNLAQQLRAVASLILQDSPTPDKCPLCHTRFEPGELRHRMKIGVDDQVESAGQELLNRVRDHEEALSDAVAAKAAVDWVKRFCEVASLPDRLTLRTALTETDLAQKQLDVATERLAALQSELSDLESQGLSLTRLGLATDRLKSLGYPLVESYAAANDLLSTIADAAPILRKRMLETKKEAEGLEEGLRITLSTSQTSTQDPGQWISMTEERLTTAAALQTKLDSFNKSFPWPSAGPLAELLVEAESIRKVANDLQAALGQEKQRLNSFATWSERKNHLEPEAEKLKAQVDRLVEAESALTTIQTKHSLTDGMRAALDDNKAVIESIFARIHSPAEFGGLGSNWHTLIRKADRTQAKLTEISTGQRAAFALSIFLAQNAQLASGAPPVVLIDDPIAHVDDLNSLSFLDYLRELVLTGKRQVFFATASEKLAALFQRKFDFLGEEFCRFNLTREMP